MIYAFFPFMAAAFYGLAFAFAEKALKLTNITTYIIINVAVSILIVLVFALSKQEGLDLEFTKSNQNLILVLIAVTTPALGWLFTLFAVKETSALYAAFSEISYPLFALIFMFLLFGLRQIDWTVFLGGALTLAGAFILVWGQMQKTS